MTSTTHTTHAAPPLTSWRSRVRHDATQGRASAQLGWKFVRARPALLLWRVLGVGVGEVLSTLLWLMVLGVLLVQIGVPGKIPHLGGAISDLARLMTSPRFLIGVVGAAASITALTWFADALTQAGVWEACAEEVDASRKSAPESLWRRAIARLPHVLAWQVSKRIMAIAGAILFIGVYVGLVKVQMLDVHLLIKASIIALLYSAGIIYAGLWLGVMSFYPAVAIVREEMHVGERLWDAARHALTQPVALYRLFLHVIAPVIPVVCLSALLMLAQGLTINVPELNSLINGLRLLVDLIGFAVVVAAGMAWHGGSTALKASWEGQMEAPSTIIARQQALQTIGKGSSRSTFAHLGSPHAEQPGILDVQLDHLRPTHTPNILPLSTLLDAKTPATSEEVATPDENKRPPNGEHP